METNIINPAFTQEDIMNIQMCRSFTYAKTKSGRFRRGFFAAVIILTAIIIIISAAVLSDVNEMILFALFFGGMILFFVCIVRICQTNAMKELTQYFRDETGIYYKVVFTQGASITVGYAISFDESNSSFDTAFSRMAVKQNTVERNKQEAQTVSAAYYYVKRFRQGFEDWNWVNGGPAKIKKLQGLSLVRKGKFKSVYTYSEGGRKKTIRIPNSYAGLSEQLSL